VSPRLPGRLSLGLATLGIMVLLCGVGPLLLPRLPGTDPAHAALLPPGTHAEVVALSDGRILIRPETSSPGPISPPLKPGPISPPLKLDREAAIVSTARFTFWLGSDRYGRDLLRELLEGGRISLLIAGSSLLLALILGVGTGILAGSSGRVLDGILMRLVDALLAFPVLFLMILVVAVFRPSVFMLVAVLGATSWMTLARLVRGQILSLRSMSFVTASRAAGSRWHQIWRLHYLPHLTGPVSQDAALRMGDLVLAEATLSYLGLGVPPSIPTWGSLVAQGHKVMLDGWWLATFPGAAIAILVIALALVGDGIHESVRRQG